jgi:Acyl-CoA synthetases (AMP-forming)/AMP-acid ligases II
MKNERIEAFIEVCQDADRIAFSTNQKKIRYITFYQDILRMRAMFETNIEKSSKVLVFVYPYSYLFYVAMFAGFMSGLQLVIIDSFKEKHRIEENLKLAQVNCILVDEKTKYLSCLFPKSFKKIHLSRYKTFSPTIRAYDITSTITTFTSGTTGTSKMICRDLSFLMSQMDLIQENLKLNREDVVYVTLPMYALLVCFLGNEIKLCRKLKNVEATVLLTSIASLLQFKKKLPSIHQCFIGGAILYKEEALKIHRVLPNAEISYVYGASEGVLIYMTSLKEYLNQPFTFSKAAARMDCSIVNSDSNGIGEIVIHGTSVISNEEYHHTGDLGYMKNGHLTIVGRSAYSKENFYNYLVDDTIRSQNPYLKTAFSFVYQEKNYCIYRGKLTYAEPNRIYIKVKRIPMDPKHKTKLNYKKVIEDYILKKRVI